MCMTSLSYAQMFYYQDHQDEILPHAKEAFKQGDYDKVVSLCDIHVSLRGRDHTEASEVERLRNDASRCKELAFDIEKYTYEGNMTMAELSSDELYKLNPYDERLKLVTTKSYLVPKTPEMPVTSKETKRPETQTLPAKSADQVESIEPKKKADAPVASSGSGEQEDLGGGYSSYYSGRDDYFPPRLIISGGASFFGNVQGSSVTLAPGIGIGMYDIAESRMGIEAKVYISPWLASSTAFLFGTDACAILRIVRGIYASAGIGFFSCSLSGEKSKPTLGLCVPGGVSFVLGKSFVIQAGISYFPEVNLSSSKVVKTSAGPSYSITLGQKVINSGIVPRVSIGFAF